MSSNVTLDYDGLLSKELEVPPAEEPSDVPLDGDSSPGLSAGPLVLQLLVQELLEEHLAHKHVQHYKYEQNNTISHRSRNEAGDRDLGEAQSVVFLLCTNCLQESYSLFLV